MTSGLTYVYCLVQSARPPLLRGVAPPVPGGDTVRLLDVPGTPRLWLVVSTVPRRDYTEEVLAREMQRLEWVGERAMAHEAVIERFLRAAAVLPMPLFTLFLSDERAVEHVVRDRPRVNRSLKKIGGQVEWGLRLTLDPGGEAAAPKPRARTSSGVDYLQRKREVRDASRKRAQKARVEAAKVFRKLKAEATAADRRTDVDRTVPASRVILDAAFLVPSRRTAAFRSALRRQTAPLKEIGVTATVTGPWPPYNFI